jgi:hypothetical protein
MKMAGPNPLGYVMPPTEPSSMLRALGGPSTSSRNVRTEKIGSYRVSFRLFRNSLCLLGWHQTWKWQFR